MLATTAGVAAHTDCLWAARLSAASTSGATEAAQATRMAGRAGTAGMTPAAWPYGPRDLPRPPRNRIVPSVRGRGRLPWGRGIRGLVRPRGPVMHAGA
jgi:hypothetical protein